MDVYEGCFFMDYVINQVVNDICASIVNYGAGAIAVGTAVMPGIYALAKKKAQKCAWLFALTMYFYFVLNLTLFNRNFGQFDNGMNLTFFQMSYFFPQLTLIHLAENFMLTLPLGFLLPLGFDIFKKPYFGLLPGFVMSMIIEYIQFYTGLGNFELDDIIMNTLGAVTGYFFLKAVTAYLDKKNGRAAEAAKNTELSEKQRI